MKKKLVILFLIATMVFGTFGSYSCTDAYSVVNTNNGTVIYNVDGFPTLLGKYVDCGSTYVMLARQQASRVSVDDAAKWMLEHNRNVYPSPSTLRYTNSDSHGNWYVVSKDAMTSYAKSSGNTLYKGWDISIIYINDIAGAIETISKYEGIEAAINKIAQELTWNRLLMEDSDSLYYIDRGGLIRLLHPCDLIPAEDILTKVTNAFIEGYTSNNPDIAAIYGTDLEALKTHYENSGKAEGRIISSTYLEDPYTSLKELMTENTKEFTFGNKSDAYLETIGVRKGVYY